MLRRKLEALMECPETIREAIETVIDRLATSATTSHASSIHRTAQSDEHGPKSEDTSR